MSAAAAWTAEAVEAHDRVAGCRTHEERLEIGQADLDDDVGRTRSGGKCQAAEHEGVGGTCIRPARKINRKGLGAVRPHGDCPMDEVTLVYHPADTQ
ncbi:hypothetical protein SAE02_61240 [Skermanella aerolata]|uniref:Uncharacterized protein n=2 Tax=Skermanella aerolata TaxID=393310 RepID=A0A512DZR8_9PROT|nr:hypothetical protein SAE02_61240 [Skermanella aerolata]